MKSHSPLVAIVTVCAFASCSAVVLAQETKARPKKTEAKEKDKDKAKEKLNPAVDNELDVRYGPEHVTMQTLGVRIKAVAGSIKDAYGTVPIPTPWPEQSLRIVKEEVSPGVRNNDYRDIGLCKQYRFHI